MRDILKYRSYEIANKVNGFSNKIVKISKNYRYYLKNVKLNSQILKNILRQDPLRNNIK